MVQCLKYRFSTFLFGQIRYIHFTPPTATDIAMSDKLYTIYNTLRNDASIQH